jgi:hypothetical protein
MLKTRRTGVFGDLYYFGNTALVLERIARLINSVELRGWASHGNPGLAQCR